MSTYHADITTQIFHKQVAPWVLGKEYFDFDDLEDFVFEREHKFPGSYLLRAIAGLDTALWDLKGKIESKPVVSLIGGSPGNLSNLWLINEKEIFYQMMKQIDLKNFLMRRVLMHLNLGLVLNVEGELMNGKEERLV